MCTFNLFLCVMVNFLLLVVFSCQYQCKQLPGKTPLQNDAWVVRYTLLTELSKRSSSSILVTERWARSWSRRTGSQPAGDFLRLPLLSTRPMVTFPAKEHHRSSTSNRLYCLVTEAHRREQLPQGCYAVSSLWELNPRAIERQSNSLPLHHCATQRFMHLFR